MTDLPLHAQTSRDIDRFIQHPSHALLIIGEPGMGKATLLDILAQRLLAIDKSARNDHRVFWAEPDGTSLGIDAVRDIQHFLTLKSAKTDPINRIVVVQDAHLLTIEAQNALLKTVEEPPADTVVLLSTTAATAILPTIVSRVQQLPVSRPPSGNIIDYFLGQGYERIEIERASAMSDGLPGLMAALLGDQSEHPLQLAASWARRLLQATSFERLVMVDELAKQRDLSANICDMLGRMAAISLRRPGLEPRQQHSWQNVLTASLKAADCLRSYAQPKLALSSLCLAM